MVVCFKPKRAYRLYLISDRFQFLNRTMHEVYMSKNALSSANQRYCLFACNDILMYTSCMLDKRYESIRPVPVTWNGVAFKSTLEARLAILYDVLNIDAEYEPIIFNLRSIKGLAEEIHRESYKPDFLIKDRSQHIVIEAKGPEPTPEEELLISAVTWYFGFPAYFQRYMFDPCYRTFGKNKAEYLEGMRNSHAMHTMRWIECSHCNCISRGIGALKGIRNNKELVWKCVWCEKDERGADRTPTLLRAYEIARTHNFHKDKRGVS